MEFQSALPTTSIVGYYVLPNLTVLRAEYQVSMGIAAGNQAVDSLPVTGWYCVHDMRFEGCSDGFICQYDLPNGDVRSADFSARHIKRVLHQRKTV
jgi:hypothetical protein